jgi:DNA-binding beta-propeller fold protein YncE
VTARGDRVGSLAVSLLLIATGIAVAADQEDRPNYLYRLTPPVRSDEIGFAIAVTADPVTGEIFVCDSRRSRILIFDSEGLYRYQISGGEVFSAPRDVAVDQDGYLFVLAHHVDGRSLIQLDFDGMFMRKIEFSQIPVVEGVRSNLTSVAVSPSGDRLYLVDSNRLEVWITDREGVIERVIKLATAPLEEARRDMIVGRVDVYGDKMLLGMPSEARVRVYDIDGNLLTSVGQRGSAPCYLTRPAAGAMDADGNVLVVDSQRMAVAGFRPEDNTCVGDYFGAGSRPGSLYYPIDIALDPMGKLYVSQGYEGRVQVYEGFLPAAELPPAPWDLLDVEDDGSLTQPAEDTPIEPENL